ncbi:cytochrome c55X [Azospirillum agricola]|uniref:c-type cytochrome n=1 Tax=Azospirillum agricola TaxID=1720247 RepID=UPI001AEB9909|nr:cytochrome c [Azospirillum agricola]MBP2230484.1 cytochrome c55X [Azospirillum agricola]
MRSPSPRGLLAAVLLAAAVPAPAPALADDAPPPGRRAALLHMLRQDCGACHGMTLKGGLGTPLLPADLAAKAPDALADVVLDGVPGTPMPPWRALLTAGEARWMIDRLREGLDR